MNAIKTNLIVALFLTFFINCLLADVAKTLSPCIAELNDGKRIDLTSLADKKSYR